MSDEIVIVEYNPAWPSEFTRFRDRAEAALGDVAIAIEHVGSTAVPGLPAKDLIDMVVVVESDEDVIEATRRLEAIGYQARGNLGVEGREAFWWPEGEKRHHLYVSPTTSAELQAQVAFRDRLRTDPEVASAYVALKRELAERYRDDRLAYTEAKTEFIEVTIGVKFPSRGSPFDPETPSRENRPSLAACLGSTTGCCPRDDRPDDRAEPSSRVDGPVSPWELEYLTMLGNDSHLPEAIEHRDAGPRLGLHVEAFIADP